MATKEKEYGVLIYDIPVTNMPLYNRIWKEMRRRCIMLNKSVYLVLWSHRHRLQQIIDEKIEEVGGQADIRFVKFDPSEAENVEEWANAALKRDIQDIVGRLRSKIEEAREENNEVNDSYFKRCNNLLRELDSLAVLYGFSTNLDGIFETARKTIATQWTARNRRLGLEAPKQLAKNQEVKSD